LDETVQLEEENSCPKCGSPMPMVDHRMAVEVKIIKILLSYRCPECGTTVKYVANIDRKTAPWVKKTVYRGASLEFVYSGS
jgi:transcription initiation factor IIE alpha subunit